MIDRDNKFKFINPLEFYRKVITRVDNGQQNTAQHE